MSSSSTSIQSAQAHFALNLLREIGSDKSTVLSPSSISIVLGMVLAGAKNNTAKEIQDAIAKDIPIDKIHKHFSTINSIDETVDEKDDEPTAAKKLKLSDPFKDHDTKINPKSGIKIANKIYFSKELEILESYKNQIHQYYSGNFQTVDFSKSVDVVNEINQFIADSTDNEIRDMVNPKMLDESNEMVLVNAIYFEKLWKKELKLQKEKSKFYSAPNKIDEIYMMSAISNYGYLKNEHLQLLRIPYQNDYYSMIIALPNERHGLSETLKDFDIPILLDFMSKNEFIEGKIVIPKFEHRSNFNLVELLQNLNIRDCFNQQQADFSGMVAAKQTCVSKVLHQALIEVSETGTKAAAATTVHKNYMSRIIYDPKFEFIADHPFLYLIVDKELNIHFIGTFYYS